MRANVVVEPQEGLDLFGELCGLIDFCPVEVLIFERAVETLHHRVGLRGVVPGGDVLEEGSFPEEPNEGVALKGDLLSVTMRKGLIFPLCLSTQS